MQVMTDADSTMADLGTASVRVRGHAVLSLIADRLAVWQVTPNGAPVGAWITADPIAARDQEAARRVLTLLERRCLATPKPDVTIQLLEALAATAAVDLPAEYAQCVLDLTTIGHEINVARASLASAVAAHGAERNSRQLTPLEYMYNVPDTVPRGTDDALAVLKLAAPVADVEPTARRVLAQSLLLRGWVRAWEDTETARLRRKYLTTARLGGAQARVLPHSWLTRLLTMSKTPLEI